MSKRERAERLQVETQLHQAMSDGTPRYLRARLFTDQVMAMMRDFLPQDRECMRRVEEHLMVTAFAANATIIQVPAECDAMDKLALERRMLEASMARLTGVIRAMTKSVPVNPFDLSGAVSTRPFRVRLVVKAEPMERVDVFAARLRSYCCEWALESTLQVVYGRHNQHLLRARVDWPIWQIIKPWNDAQRASYLA